jgi:hypothetical protein
MDRVEQGFAFVAMTSFLVLIYGVLMVLPA